MLSGCNFDSLSFQRRQFQQLVELVTKCLVVFVVDKKVNRMRGVEEKIANHVQNALAPRRIQEPERGCNVHEAVDEIAQQIDHTAQNGQLCVIGFVANVHRRR